MAGLAQGSREREIAPNSRGHSRLSCALAAASAGWSKKVGDIGFLDEAGVLHALGRATDIRGGDGRAIGPTPIEEVLRELPDVRYATAFAANADAN